MKFLTIFKKRDGEYAAEKEKRVPDIKELEIYSGIRVVVETQKGQLLFIADLLDPNEGTATLCQCSDRGIIRDEENVGETGQIEVRLRGYNRHKRKAVLMEGRIKPKDKHIWQVEDLTIIRVENERAFYRLDTDIDGIIDAEEGENSGERPCKLLNISEGGVSIRSEYRYHKGERFSLKVKLLEDGAEMRLYGEVLRVMEKNEANFEYGCQFLNLTKAGLEQIDAYSVMRQHEELHN